MASNLIPVETTIRAVKPGDPRSRLSLVRRQLVVQEESKQGQRQQMQKPVQQPGPSRQQGKENWA